MRRIGSNTTQKGFLLIEVLVVMTLLAIVFTFFIGAMTQVAGVSQKSSQVTEAISKSELLFFEVESGLRPDLAGYSGHGDLGWLTQ